MGDVGHTVSDPTAVIISNNGDGGNSYSAPEGLERTSNYKGSAEVSDGNDPPKETCLARKSMTWLRIVQNLGR